MTSVQTMLKLSPRSLGRCALALLIAVAGIPGGCEKKPELLAPNQLIAPYPPGSSLPLWAVAPMNNESGTTAVDQFAVTDAIIAKASEVKGLATIPLNRTLAAMRALKMPAVQSPGDARRLVEALGADGIVIGTITAYDPYNPPKMGLTLGLFLRNGSRLANIDSGIDPMKLRTAPTDATAMAAAPRTEPESIVQDYLDANNHSTLLALQRYAEGRHDRTNALGWRKYLVSMDLYTEFAAYISVEHLLQAEQARLGGVRAEDKSVPPSKP